MKIHESEILIITVWVFLDSSDYIGCFDTTGSISTYIDLNTNAMKPCECIGFCLTKDFLFAGITYG